MSDAQTQLLEALLAARRSCPPTVHKAGKNKDQNYPYAGHEHVLTGGARDAMQANGLTLLLVSTELIGPEPYRTSGGEKMVWRWRGRFLLLHTAGGSLELTYEATTGCNDKSAFVASTALDRTAYLRVLAIAGSAEENPEHDANNEPKDKARRGREEPRTSPTSAQTSGEHSQKPSGSGSQRRQTSAPRSDESRRSAPPSTDRELPTTAECWRAAHDAVCKQLFEHASIAPGIEDVHGLPQPSLPCPRFSDTAKVHAGERYDAVPAGYLRSALWTKPKFWAEAGAPQRQWVSFLVTRRALEKLEQAEAERALGEVKP